MSRTEDHKDRSEEVQRDDARPRTFAPKSNSQSSRPPRVSTTVRRFASAVEEYRADMFIVHRFNGVAPGRDAGFAVESCASRDRPTRKV